MLRTCDISFLILWHCSVFFYKTTFGIRMHARGLEGKKTNFLFIASYISYLNVPLFIRHFLIPYLRMLILWVPCSDWQYCVRTLVSEGGGTFFCFHKNGIVYLGLPTTKLHHRRKYKRVQETKCCVWFILIISRDRVPLKTPRDYHLWQ